MKVSQIAVRRITLDLPYDLHRKLKAVSALRVISMRKIIMDAIDKELRFVRLEDVQGDR